MLCLMDGFFLKPKLCSCSALVFKHLVMLLLLIDSNKGQSLGVGPSQTVVAFIGDDVTLPCQLEPAVDAVSLGVEWGRHDLEPRFVHVWYEGQNLLDNQNPSYKGRTSVSMEKLRRGDLSLSLSAVKNSDNGAYRCYFPSQDKQSTVELVVGSFSSPLITHISKSGSGVVVECESKGWYPEPEVLWLDSEGKVFSDGPTETLRGPDGLFTVSSRVTVEKRESNIFTCRVHQRNINRTRETHIQISADVFETCSSTAAHISIIVVLVLGYVFAAAFVFWKWRQIQIKEAKRHQAESGEREKLMAEKMADWEKKRKRLEEDLQKDLKEKKNRLEEDLKKKEEEEKDLERNVHKLTEQSKEVKKQRDELRHEEKDMQRNIKDINDKFQSAEEKAEGDRGQAYVEMKRVAVTAKSHLEGRGEEDRKLDSKIDVLRNTTDGVLKVMKERKKAVESNKRDICEQLKEIERKLSENRQKT